MNISIENRGEGSSLIKVTVNESDYGQAVDSKLKEYKKKANIPGFRPGMVPMGLVNKMYRKGVVAEEAYRAASQAAFDHIEKEKIDIIGDIIPSDEQVELDFDNNTEHEFDFEIGLAPTVDIQVDTKDKLTRYKIKIDDKMYDAYKSNFVRRFGKLEDVDTVTSDEAISGTLDNDQINVEDAYVGLISMSEEERKPFVGKKVGEVLDVDINELYKSPSQRAAILKMKEEELSAVDPKFKLTITKIRKFVEPDLDEEFFKTAFPDGSISDQAGFEKFIKDQIEADLGRESEMVYNYQLRKLLLQKANLVMPETFLRKWLYTINEGKFTMEEIDKDFGNFVEMMKWNLIQGYYAKQLDIKIEPDEAIAEAKNYAAAQFAQYGLGQVGDEMLENYAKQILSNKEEARKIYDKLYEQKVVEAVTPMLKITEKQVSAEEFGKLAEKIVNPD